MSSGVGFENISFDKYSIFEKLVCACDTELPTEEREKWEAFISGQLADTNKRNTVDLVSKHLAIFSINLNSTMCYLSLNIFVLCLPSNTTH